MNKEEHPGLYIHVPFCRSKCLYCDFYSTASLASLPMWLEAVKKEALFYREEFPRFDSLYIGGGTPTVLDEGQLGSLIESLRENFEFCPGSEITIEANPDGLTGAKLKAVSKLGVNRISLGVQSLDDGDLKYLGRSHTAAQAIEALDSIRSSGFSAIGVDLIYGFEVQTLRGWKKTIDRVLEFGPEHISCYQLTFEKGSALSKMRAAGRVRPIGEKMEGAFFVWTSRYLERRGYLHYEISNFARSPEFMSRHNRKYWDHTPYLGLGPSAHSFRAGRRWWNVGSIGQYCRLISEGAAPVKGLEELTPEQIDLESLYLGFRKSEGVDLRVLGEGPEENEALADLQKSGLVRVSGGRAKPTRRGFLVADRLPLAFYN